MWKALLWLILATFVVCGAQAQQHHAAGHNDYSGWSSEKTANCCNNEDCGDLEDTQWRATPTGDQILIKGKWCPIEKKHYTTKGKSPDWRKAHACVNNNPNYSPAGGDDCDRLLCFMGNGGV